MAAESSATKRRRKDADTGLKFGFTSNDLVGNYQRELMRNRQTDELGEARFVEPIIPRSRAGLLREMSQKRLVAEDLDVSMFSHVVARECDALLKSYAETGAGDGVTTERDVNRVARRADDFVLVSRDKTDEAHRARLWVARCKLAELQAVMHENDGGPAAARDEESPIDNLRAASEQVSDEMLAQWMAEMTIGDASVVRFSEASRTWQHSLDSCGLSALWSTIRSLRDRWPFLELSPYLYTILDRLRLRVAFFLNLCEPFDETRERERGRNQAKILGLSRSNWRAVDPAWVHGSAYSTRAPAAAAVRADTSLLNAPEMVRTVDGENGRRFRCVDEVFICETERSINSMLIDLRKCAGFEWHDYVDDTECDCVTCAELCTRADVVKERSEARLLYERFVAGECAGGFKDYVQQSFREFIWDPFLQPGEREGYKRYRPMDDESARGVISRGRPSDGKNITRRYGERNVAQVWAEFSLQVVEKDKDPVLLDYTKRTDPACSLLGRIAVGFYLDGRSNGAQFAFYTIDCHNSNEPFEFNKERLGKHRQCFAEFYTPHKTTGSLCWRYKHMRRNGLRSPDTEIYYEHPLIMRTMASFCVLHQGRMHLCASFGEAFVVWVATMCEDNNLGGEMHTDYSLLDLYEQFYPTRKARVTKLRSEIAKKKRQWDPTTRLWGSEADLAPKAGAQHGVIQFAVK